MSTKVLWDSDEVKSLFMTTVVRASNVVAIELLEGVQKNLNKRAGPPSSRPGKPPAKRTGTLARSWQSGGHDYVKIESRTPTRYSQRIGSNLVYAMVHEYGGIRHPKRPYVFPVFMKTAKRLERITAPVFRRAFKGIAGGGR